MSRDIVYVCTYFRLGVYRMTRLGLVLVPGQRQEIAPAFSIFIRVSFIITKTIMTTSNTKPPTYLARNLLAVGIAICDTQWVHTQSLQSILKNVKRSPI